MCAPAFTDPSPSLHCFSPTHNRWCVSRLVHSHRRLARRHTAWLHALLRSAAVLPAAPPADEPLLVREYAARAAVLRQINGHQLASNLTKAEYAALVDAQADLLERIKDELRLRQENGFARDSVLNGWDVTLVTMALLCGAAVVTLVRVPHTPHGRWMTGGRARWQPLVLQVSRDVCAPIT